MAENEQHHPPQPEDVRQEGAAGERQPAPLARADEPPPAALPALPERLARALSPPIEIFEGQDGEAYLAEIGPLNRRARRIASRDTQHLIRENARQAGISLSTAEVKEIAQTLIAHAHTCGKRRAVWYRVAPVDGGIEVDLCDEAGTRVRVTAGRVDLLTEGSETYFVRTPRCRPMAMPAASGDPRRLRRYVNLVEAEFVLLLAWITYTIAHPKSPTSKFVILVLLGGQGTGKTFLAELLLRLIDPSTIGVQRFPRSARDLAICAMNAHAAAFDNVRALHPAMSDAACIASTGGSVTTRQLYSDADLMQLPLHLAMIFTSIHAFVTEPDLAQRCLFATPPAIGEDRRRSEADLARRFEADLPAIQRGLFDLIAEIFRHLATVEVTSPERMIDFVRWLAAMEKVDGAPAGTYQDYFSAVVNEGQLESLLDDVLGSTVLRFAAKQRQPWVGTPADLFDELTALVSRETQWSRAWPRNAISMSLRLRPLAAALLTQGVRVEFTRGRDRTITITRTEETK